MDLLSRYRRGLAAQLGRPRGWRGRLVGRRLNRGNRNLVTAAVQACELTAGDRAVDIGFGGGAGLEILLGEVMPGGQVHGVDLSVTMIAGAQRRFRRELNAGALVLRAGSISDLPLTQGSLDAVITVNTIYFVADLDRAFAELHRVLAPSGRAVIGLGDPVAMRSMPVTEHGFVVRPVDEIVAALVDAGLTSVQRRRTGAGAAAPHLLVARAAQ